MTNRFWKELQYPSPPEEFLMFSPNETDEDKKKKLMVALDCNEEEADKIQAHLLPPLPLSSDASHL